MLRFSGLAAEFTHQVQHSPNWSFKPSPQSPISRQSRGSIPTNIRPTRWGRLNYGVRPHFELTGTQLQHLARIAPAIRVFASGVACLVHGRGLLFAVATRHVVRRGTWHPA